jgi:hypothetical protein
MLKIDSLKSIRLESWCRTSNEHRTACHFILSFITSYSANSEEQYLVNGICTCHRTKSPLKYQYKQIQGMASLH